MTFTDIFWIFLVGASVLPAIRQQLLVMARLRKLRELERKRESRTRIVSTRADLEQAEELAEILATGTWIHDYPITVSEAKDLGIPASMDVLLEVYDLMDLHPQTSQRRPSVQYVPMPYRGGDRPPSAGRD